MTWYDGEDPPVPAQGRRDEPGTRAPRGGGRHAAAMSRTRLRVAAAPADGDVPHALDGVAAGPDERTTSRARRLTGVRWRVPPRTAAIALVALALIGGAVTLRAAATPTAPAVTLPEPAVTASSTPDPAPSPADDAVVWVHVVGQVGAPGLVSLPVGSRVADALAAAGGALPDADLAALNLAAVVQDGAQVRVPAPGESVDGPPDGVADGASAAGGAVAESGGGADGTVDVNAAGAAELEALPGIGPVLAERIVAWRTEHGPFATVDGLQDVPGIGPAVLGQLRDRVRV